MAVSVLCLIFTVPWVGLQCVIVVFPDHTQLFLWTYPICFKNAFNMHVQLTSVARSPNFVSNLTLLLFFKMKKEFQILFPVRWLLI